VSEYFSLFFSKEESKLEIKDVKSGSSIEVFIEENKVEKQLVEYNHSHYVSSSKIDLISKASELRSEWLTELIEKQHKLNAIKF